MNKQRRIRTAKTKTLRILCICLAAVPQLAQAEWHGRISGGTSVSGDDQRNTIGLIVTNDARPLTHKIEAEYTRNENNLETYEIIYEPRYWFSDDFYAFGEGGLETFEDFSLDNYQGTVGGGIGINLIKTEKSNVYAEAGLFTLFTFVDADVNNGTEFSETDFLTGVEVGGNHFLTDNIRLELETAYSVSERIEQGSAEISAAYRVLNGSIKYTFEYVRTEFGENDVVDFAGSEISFDYGF